MIFIIWPELTKNIDFIPLFAAIIALFALFWQIHVTIKEIKYLVVIDMNTKVDGNYVFITCCVKNLGSRPIYPSITNLYITEGREISVYSNNDEKEECITKYDFERITEHTVDQNGQCFDCEIAKYCKGNSHNKDMITVLPECKDDNFKKGLRCCINLRQLSGETIVHILPNEVFYEDVVLKIDNPGVYRAFAIYTDKEWDDCTCRSSLFKIEKEEGDI